jgi:ABC-type oligopeptide transport system ATPase subunit
MSSAKKLLSAVDLSVTFKVPSGSLRAVDTVSFYVSAGETVAIVGESGSGKTTLALSLMRAYAPTSGNLFFEDQDITHLSEKALKDFRKKVQMVFQDQFKP